MEIWKPSRIGLFLTLLAGLSGCAMYRPLPLAEHPDQATSVDKLTVNRDRLPFPALAAHRFDPSDGLDMDEVAMLAVANNPDLKLARDDAHVSRAQSFAARLLPDPQVSLTRDYPQSSGPGVTSAFNVGLSYDLGTLVSHAAGLSAAREDDHKTNLNLLWQEWQVIAQARQLFFRSISQKEQLRWLISNRDLLAEREKQTRLALAAGDLTADGANAGLIAEQDAARQVSELERQHLQTRHDLNALLGLAPDVELHLVEGEALALPDEQTVRDALDHLPQRRPDLMALRAGYAAEDARYRQAILAQFPPLNLGLTRARDTAGLFTRGFALSMALPLLNGNRGNVRIEEATRRRLHDEYQMRMNSAQAEVQRLLADNKLMADQLKTAAAALPRLDQAADRAGQALTEGDLDGTAYAAFQSARIAKHVEVANLRQSLLESRITLMNLLGGDFPARPELPEK